MDRTKIATLFRETAIEESSTLWETFGNLGLTTEGWAKVKAASCDVTAWEGDRADAR